MRTGKQTDDVQYSASDCAVRMARQLRLIHALMQCDGDGVFKDPPLASASLGQLGGEPGCNFAVYYAVDERDPEASPQDGERSASMGV